MALNIHEKGLTVPKTLSVRLKWKIWRILCLQASNLAPKWVAGVRHGNSLVVCRVSPGKKIVVLFWKEICWYAVPRQIKPGILELTITGGQSNFGIFFIFVNCKEKGYCRVVSVGQLSFVWHSHHGLSRRMQGDHYKQNCSFQFCHDRFFFCELKPIKANLPYIGSLRVLLFVEV